MLYPATDAYVDKTVAADPMPHEAIAALTAERDRLVGELAEAKRAYASAMKSASHVNTLLCGRLARCREALDKYGRHQVGCGVLPVYVNEPYMRNVQGCTCGFKDALTETES